MRREADVLGDLEEPGFLRERPDPALKSPQCVDKCGLHRVLGLLARREPADAEAEDPLRVALEEAPGDDLGRNGDVECFNGGHWALLIYLRQGRQGRYPSIE